MPRAMYSMLIFVRSARFFSRNLTCSRKASRNSRSRPARWWRRASSGSSNTSRSQCAPRSTSAG
ncbi:Uncharacterised protein [Bordetella pertussis]|nr:Uncharacterised protein [Bordetella pertussis]